MNLKIILISNYYKIIYSNAVLIKELRAKETEVTKREWAVRTQELYESTFRDVSLRALIANYLLPIYHY